MKQRFLLSLFFVCSFMITTRAQISKGATWLGGSIGYNKTKDVNGDQSISNKTNSFNISPAVGKVVKDNLVIGITLLYREINHENISITTKNEDKETNYGGGLFVRRYLPVVGRLYFFGDANAGFTSFKVEDKETYYVYNTTSEFTHKGWTASLGITPGLSYGITKNLQLETSLSNLFAVSYTKSKKPGVKNSQFSAGIAADGKSQFNVGCRFLFNNKG